MFLARVLFVADADQGDFHEGDDGGEDFFARQAGLLEVLVDAFANGREGFGEESHALVLSLVADFAPARVITALLAAAGVASGGLEVSVGDGADPDVGPGGWDDEGLDAGEGVTVADGLVVGVGVTEGLAVAGAVDAGFDGGDEQRRPAALADSIGSVMGIGMAAFRRDIMAEMHGRGCGLTGTHDKLRWRFPAGLELFGEAGLFVEKGDGLAGY